MKNIQEWQDKIAGIETIPLAEEGKMASFLQWRVKNEDLDPSALRRVVGSHMEVDPMQKNRFNNMIAKKLQADYPEVPLEELWREIVGAVLSILADKSGSNLSIGSALQSLEGEHEIPPMLMKKIMADSQIRVNPKLRRDIKSKIGPMMDEMGGGGEEVLKKLMGIAFANLAHMGGRNIGTMSALHKMGPVGEGMIGSGIPNQTPAGPPAVPQAPPQGQVQAAPEQAQTGQFADIQGLRGPFKKLLDKAFAQLGVQHMSSKVKMQLLQTIIQDMQQAGLTQGQATKAVRASF